MPFVLHPSRTCQFSCDQHQAYCNMPTRLRFSQSSRSVPHPVALRFLLQGRDRHLYKNELYCEYVKLIILPISSLRYWWLSTTDDLALNFPAWMTFSSMSFFCLADCIIRSSMELIVINRRTTTSDFCPIRWARASAYSMLSCSSNIAKKTLTCSSWCGFQSLSKIMTVSAVCKFKPSPPARVLRKRINYLFNRQDNIAHT